MNKVTAALLMAAMTGCGVAVAQDSTFPDALQVDSEVIRYDASKVHDDRSAKRLFYQIRKAAEDVCRISSHPVGYERWVEHDCEADAVAKAVSQSGIPVLREFTESSPAFAHRM